MKKRCYSEINLHITWHTKGNLPVLRDAVEERFYRYVRHRIVAKGAIPHALGGTDDHVHVAVSVPPWLEVSSWIGELKGASAYYVNHQVANRKYLEWQHGYGVVSFGTRDLDWVVKYIENQREHHARGTTRRRLEQIFADG